MITWMTFRHSSGSWQADSNVSLTESGPGRTVEPQSRLSGVVTRSTRLVRSSYVRRGQIKHVAGLSDVEILDTACKPEIPTRHSAKKKVDEINLKMAQPNTEVAEKKKKKKKQ